MAYASKELKERLAPHIKEVLKKFNAKGSIAIKNSMMSLVVTVSASPIEFVLHEGGYRTFTNSNFHNQNELAREFLSELTAVLNSENYNNSNTYIDYYDVGYYTEIKIGRIDKPYNLI